MKKNESSQFMKSALLQFLILGYSLGFFFFQPAFSMDGKYMLMFLICNGILVFLAKSSTCIPASSPTADEIKTSVDYQHATDPDAAAADDDFIAEDEEQHQEEAQVEEGEKAEYLIEEGEGKERDESLCFVTKGMEPNEELLSRDELNKKVEEFIRKMKEGIRIEAQQQLVAV